MSTVQYYQNVILADAIKAKRGGMSLRETADLIGAISASTLSRIERHELPDIDTFLRLCGWLNRPITDFVGNSPEPLPEYLQKLVHDKRMEIAVRRNQAAALNANADLIEQRINTAIRMHHDGSQYAASYIVDGPRK